MTVLVLIHADIILSNPHPTRHRISPQAALRFLSIVEVRSVPLYVTVGAPLDVYTHNESSKNLLEGIFTSFVESGSSNQLDCGLLLKVDEDSSAREAGYCMTELLLYAAISGASGNLPTQPSSSLPAPVDHTCTFSGSPESPADHVIVKLYALPICSDIIEHARKISSRPTEPLPTKRQNLTTRFEEASIQRRRFKGRGGESISMAMANIDRPSSQYGIADKPPKDRPGTVHVLEDRDSTLQALSRTSSTASPGIDQSRPSSRSGTLVNKKRSSLHRVESIFSPREDSATPDTDNTYAQQNKAALTRIVMAGMRLHGLQQKKKPTKDLQSPVAEDEYKLIYHQTSKAAGVALRKSWTVEILGQETMRDVVDRLLDIFCTDSMTSTGSTSGAGGFSIGQQEVSSIFDLPSSSARSNADDLTAK